MSEDKLHAFKVYVDGSHREMQIAASSAAEAAEDFWEDRLLSGEETVNLHYDAEERIIVEHPEGPKIDPSVTWHTDEEGTFAIFNVEVSIEVRATNVKDK